MTDIGQKRIKIFSELQLKRYNIYSCQTSMLSIVTLCLASLWLFGIEAAFFCGEEMVQIYKR